MAQQQYRREVTQLDEQGNPVRKIDEHGNVVQTDTGIRVEREFRHTGEQRNPIHSATGGTTLGDYVSPGHHHDDQRGTGTGTFDTDSRTIGRATEGTRTDYSSTGQTGFRGLGTERGPTSGTIGPETGFQGEGMEGRTMGGHQGLGQGLGTGYNSGGRSTGQTGYQGLGTEPGRGGHHRGQETGPYGHQGVGGNVARATVGAGADYTSGGRSVGQTGYQGLGTEPAPGGGFGTGTGTGARYGTDEQQQSTTTGGYGDTREKKGMMEKIKEKLPGHK